MSQPDFPPINPYQPPADAPVIPAIDPGAAALREKIKKFRDQIHALGAFWIIIGGLAAGLGIFLLTSPTEAAVEGAQLISGFVVLAGMAWVGLGIATCLKQLWAVYIGLGLSYLSVLGNLLRFNICGLVLLAVVIVQAHRVIGWARELKAMGIPLNTRP